MADVTPDERRRVAERLRATGQACEDRGYPWLVEDLLQAIGFETYEEGSDRLFEALADLIDPTCHNAAGPRELFSCSECGRTFYERDFGQLDYEYAGIFDYCPNCGARVVAHGKD